MSRLAIAFVLALAATAANAQDTAQDTKSGQSTPAVASADGTRPFLFDGRMIGDGIRQRPLADDHQPNAGALVLPPKASQPPRER